MRTNPIEQAEHNAARWLTEAVWAGQFVSQEVSHLMMHGTCFEKPLAVRVPGWCSAVGKALAWLERFCALAGLKDNLYQQVTAAYRKQRDSLPPLPPEYQKGG